MILALTMKDGPDCICRWLHRLYISEETDSRAAKATIARQSGGKRLFAAFDPPPEPNPRSAFGQQRGEGQRGRGSPQGLVGAGQRRSSPNRL